MFDWENAIALDTMQGNRASSCREGQVAWVFSRCGRNLGYILELQRGCPFETLVNEVTSVFFSSCDSLVGDSLEFNQAYRGSLCV